jgi:putative spermidine/putrescine transport system permease protein
MLPQAVPNLRIYVNIARVFYEIGLAGTYFVGVSDVTTLPLLMFNASMGGNYQITSITALLLLVPSIGFMLVVERFLKADVLAMVGR